MSRRDRLLRGAMALLALSCLAALVGALLPWELGGAFEPGGPTARTVVGRAAAGTLAVAIGVQALRRGREVAPVAILGGLGIVAVALWAVQPGGAVVTALAGVGVATAGGVAGLAGGDAIAPRPLAGLGLPGRRLGVVAAVGGALVVLSLAAKVVPQPGGGDPAGLAMLSFLGVAPVVGGLWAWSRPLALPLGAYGGTALVVVWAGLRGPPATPELGMLAGSVLLSAAALLELGGASRRGDGTDV